MSSTHTPWIPADGIATELSDTEIAPTELEELGPTPVPVPQPGPGIPGPGPEPGPEPWPWPWPQVPPPPPGFPFPHRPPYDWRWRVPQLPLHPKLIGSISGRYRARTRTREVELRVDIDGPTATNRVSADYFARSGARTTYLGSMRVDVLTITTALSGEVELHGVGAFNFAVTAPVISVRISRPSFRTSPGSAQLDHLTSLGQPGDSFTCAFESRAFRAVAFEQDRETAVTDPFDTYDTGQLQSGGAARTLGVVSAYAEAGVELSSTGPMGTIATGAGADASWSDAELHAAMQAEFSAWVDRPHWATWLFHADLHDLGTGLKGIMFDQQGPQRQGAAVFYRGMGGNAPTTDDRRLQLYCCVHELGHTFNLLHSWQKSLANPPGTDRPTSMSWMNYPWKFNPVSTYWTGFGFRFDEEELVHIRHGFRPNVIQGGDPFAVNSALFDASDANGDAGVRLELRLPSRALPWGTPVTVEMELSNPVGRPVTVPAHLGPRSGSVQFLIERPDGRSELYRPMLHHCNSDEDTVVLRAGDLHADTAFVHFGADGFPFDAVGTYRVRGLYTNSVGAATVSEPVTLVVSPPMSADDAYAGEVMLDEQVGALLYLVGSANPRLARGRDRLRELQERLPDHSLGRLAALVEAATVGRDFKLVENGAVEVATADPDRASQLLGAVNTGSALVTEDGVRVLTESDGSLGDDVVRGYMNARSRELDIAFSVGG